MTYNGTDGQKLLGTLRRLLRKGGWFKEVISYFKYYKPWFKIFLFFLTSIKDFWLHFILQYVFTMSLLHLCALTMVIPLLSMEGQKALGFHQKYLNLCSRRWKKVLRVWIDMRVSSYWHNFHFWWTIPLNTQILYKLCNATVVDKCFQLLLWGRGLHGSKNSYPNPKRPVNVLCGTDPDPYFIWKWDPNPCRPEKCLKCTTRTRRGPDHYSKVGPEPGWEDTDPTVPIPIGTYCTANAMKSINVAKKKNFLP